MKGRRGSVRSLLKHLRSQRSRIELLEVELAEMNRELASFSYSVSHDLRSPLRTIEGFSEALAEDYRDRLDEQGLDYLKRVRSATARMEQLIGDLLALTRVSRGELRRERVNLSEMSQAIAGELSLSDPAREVAFSIEPQLEVTGDPALLKIALTHLLENAWKFTSGHPSARIEVGSERVNGSQTLYVRDDGAGFDPTFADRLFAPFQRLHGAAEFAGNGIGLAIVRRIVHRHGGKVRATGQVDKGATIFLDFA